MKQQKISWKKTSHLVTEIRIIGKNNDDPIGYVKLTNNFKWDIHPYFVVLVEDKYILNKHYDTDIEAGRILAKLWNITEELNIRDTEEFFFTIDDLFGSVD